MFNQTGRAKFDAWEKQKGLVSHATMLCEGCGHDVNLESAWCRQGQKDSHGGVHHVSTPW